MILAITKMRSSWQCYGSYALLVLAVLSTLEFVVAYQTRYHGISNSSVKCNTRTYLTGLGCKCNLLGKRCSTSSNSFCVFKSGRLICECKSPAVANSAGDICQVFLWFSISLTRDYNQVFLTGMGTF